MQKKSPWSKVLRRRLSGILSFIAPGTGVTHTGGTQSARYCYAVAMRHLLRCWENGMISLPRRIAEFGPGDSIGTGLCMMLLGVDEYLALDVVEYADLSQNLTVFDELINLCSQRSDIPDEKEFPNIQPKLQSYAFPSHIFTDKHFIHSMAPRRIRAIRDALLSPGTVPQEGTNPISIRYIVPWTSHEDSLSAVDMIFSQAVMEHVDHLSDAYAVMYGRLAPGGFMAHSIDFTSHNLTRAWNGHWAMSDTYWKFVRGKRTYLINRAPLSEHLRCLENIGASLLEKTPQCDESLASIRRNQLARTFRGITDEDFKTAGVYLCVCRRMTENNSTIIK